MESAGAAEQTTEEAASRTLLEEHLARIEIHVQKIGHSEDYMSIIGYSR